MIKVIVGIECGSKKSAISKIGRQGLESVTSESSNQEIPSVVVFEEEQRLFAELAQDRVKANPQTSVFSPFRLCCQSAINEAKDNFCFFNLKEQQQGEDPNKRDTMVVRKESLRFIQVVGAYLTYLDNLINKSTPQQQGYACMVSVPNYFSLKEKIKLQKATQISMLPCLGIVDEHQAVAYSYLWFQKKELHGKSKRVMFIDIGETQMSCFIYNFSGLVGNAEYVDSRGEIGVRTIDRGVYAFLARTYPQVFSSGKGINKKSMLRILEAIQRLRKVLSSNSDANLLIECVTADDDIQHQFTRAEFDSIIKLTGFIKQLEELLNRAISFCLQQEIQVADFQLLGGGTRIPLVLSTIKTFLRREQLGITMQGSETISKGCAIACAVFSSSQNQYLKIEPYKITTVMSQESVVELYLQDQKCAEQRYTATQYLPYTASISAGVPKKPEDEMLLIKIDVKFNGVVYSTTEHHLHKDEIVNVKYRIIENGTLTILSAAIDLPKSAMIDEARDKGQREIMLKMTVEGDDIDEQSLAQFIIAEKIARENDEKVMLRQERRNQLEIYINESLRFISEKMNSGNQNETIQFAVRILQDNKEFIEGNLQVSLEEVLERGKMVRDVFEPLKQMHDQRRQPSMQATASLVVNSLDQLKNISMMNANKEIRDFSLMLANQSIGDGSVNGFLNIFKSPGASKMKEYLSALTITRSLSMVLGNNSLSDVGLDYIFSGIEAKSTTCYLLTELKLSLESNVAQQNTNVFTMEGLYRIVRFLRKLDSLENFQLILNYLDKVSAGLIQNALSEKKHLKSVQLVVRNYDVDPSVDRQSFVNNVSKVCKSVEFDCYNSKGVKVF